jgi:hypothetical protein
METVGQSGAWKGNASCRTSAHVLYFVEGDGNITLSYTSHGTVHCPGDTDYQVEVRV